MWISIGFEVIFLGMRGVFCLWVRVVKISVLLVLKRIRIWLMGRVDVVVFSKVFLIVKRVMVVII